MYGWRRHEGLAQITVGAVCQRQATFDLHTDSDVAACYGNEEQGLSTVAFLFRETAP